MKEFKFQALIQESEIGRGGAYVEFPFNVQEEFGVNGRVKVTCHFEDIEYHGSLVKMGTQCHIIGITKEIRNKLGKKIGDKIEVRLYKDETERTVEVHPLLIEEFKQDKSLQEKYESLSFTKKKEIFKKLTSAKKEETLKNRLEKILSELKENI